MCGKNLQQKKIVLAETILSLYRFDSYREFATTSDLTNLFFRRTYLRNYTFFHNNGLFFLSRSSSYQLNEISVYHKHITGAGNRIQVQTLVSIGFTLTLSLWVELSGKNTLSE